MASKTCLDRHQLSRILELVGECLPARVLAQEFPELTQEHIRHLFQHLAEHVRTCQDVSGFTASVRERRHAAEEVAVLYCDGASRGNPGPSGAGALLLDKNGKLIFELSRFLDTATNNQAEYQALIYGLQAAGTTGIRRLRIALDSELVVKQIRGEYRVRQPRLQRLFDQAMSRLRQFDDYAIVHVGREQNRHADRLAGEAIDRALRGGSKVTYRWVQREYERTE